MINRTSAINQNPGSDVLVNWKTMYEKLAKAGKVYSADKDLSISKKDGLFAIEFSIGLFAGSDVKMKSFPNNLAPLNGILGTVIGNNPETLKRVFIFNPKTPLVQVGDKENYTFSQLEFPDSNLTITIKE